MFGSIKVCTLFTIAITMFSISGCGRGEPAGQGGAVAEDHAHEHAHEHEGPHGGHVIELGADNYHAELTHDEATHTVAVYILDGSAAANAPVAVESVLINALANETPQQYTLLAKPRPDDPAGKSSYFELVDEQLCDGLTGAWDPHASKARLNLTIDGTPYVGDIELHEEGGEHDHADDHGHE